MSKKIFHLFLFLIFFTFFFEKKIAFSACYDSDAEFGAITIQSYIPGYCIDDEGRYDDVCTNQFGFFYRSVMEYYCKEGKCVGVEIPCLITGQQDNYCKDGACAGKTLCENLPDGCRDLFGTYRNYCINETTIGQYSCNQIKCVLNEVTCPSGQICKDGICVPKSECKDSDGLDVYTFGKCEDAFVAREDECTFFETISGQYKGVKEFYCDSDPFGNKICNSMELKCPPGYICDTKAPRCVLFSITCTDSDGGENIFETGTCTRKVENSSIPLTDFCETENKVREYYCGKNAQNEPDCQYKVLDCPEGYACQNGKCIQLECQDSDNGKNKFVAGECFEKETGQRFRDYCLNKDYLNEYFCQKGKCEGEQLKCDDGQECYKGACLNLSCEEVPGEKKCIEKIGNEIKAVFSYHCFMEDRVVEYHCDGEKCKEEIKVCPPGTECKNGECVAKEKKCIDSDGGENKEIAGSCTDSSGTFEDECLDKETVKEYFCEENQCQFKSIKCNQNQKCEGGKCVNLICEDSDGGKNVEKAGYCKSDGEISNDFCVNETTVREYFCENWKCEFEDINCPGGFECKGGECIKKVEEEGICKKIIPCKIGECNICHLFLIFQRIITCILFGIVPPFALLLVVIGAFLYAGGVLEILPTGLETVSRGKKLFTNVVIALLLIYACWLFFSLFLYTLGYTSPTGRWWEIECKIEKEEKPKESFNFNKIIGIMKTDYANS
jgi:hypothetical protein